MLKAGITGGIGSGKTTVCKLFELFDVPVYYADEESKRILHSNKEVHQKIIALFGDEVFDDFGEINRKKIAAIVFQNEKELKKLNSVLHPAVRAHFEEWLKQHQSKPYILKEAAILFESGAYLQMDKIISVLAPEDLRIKRAIQRDNVSEEEVKRRMKMQFTDNERSKKSHYLLYNDELQLLIPQVLSVHQQLLRI